MSVRDNTPSDADDLAAALDFTVPGDGAAPSDLDALDVYATAETAESHDPVFTVANPDGSVVVTAAPDGAVKSIDLSAKATDMTEADLAHEIVVVARLAAQDAKSAQYTYMLEAMRAQGHDDAATRDFLTRDLDLPTPEQAAAERERVFATRHGGGRG